MMHGLQGRVAAVFWNLNWIGSATAGISGFLQERAG
jgi:hypothetical protein